MYIGGELKNRENCHEYLLTGCSDTYFQDTIAGLNPLAKKSDVDINTVPIVTGDATKEPTFSSIDIDIDNLALDTKILEYYNNKYIGIPGEFTESDEFNEENVQSIQQLITAGLLELVDVDETIMDENEKKYTYYRVIINAPFEPKKRMITKFFKN